MTRQSSTASAPTKETGLPLLIRIHSKQTLERGEVCGNLLHAETSRAVGEGGVRLGVQVGESIEGVDVDGGHVDGGGGTALFRKKHWWRDG